MGIGTSQGAYYDSEFHMTASQFQDGWDNNEDNAPQPIADIKTSSPFVTITDEDIDKGIGTALSFSGGGLSVTRMPEAIKSAAIKIGEEIHEGHNHGLAYESYLNKNPSKDVYDVGPEVVDEGFTTTHGRFIDRKEAMDIAKQRDQIRHPDIASEPSNTWLLSEDLK